MNDNGSPVFGVWGDELHSALVGNNKFRFVFVFNCWPCNFRKLSKEEMMSFTH